MPTKLSSEMPPNAWVAGSPSGKKLEPIGAPCSTAINSYILASNTCDSNAQVAFKGEEHEIILAEETTETKVTNIGTSRKGKESEGEKDPLDNL